MARLFATPPRQPGLAGELRAAMEEEEEQAQTQATSGLGEASTASREANPDPLPTSPPTTWEVVTNQDEDEDDEDDSDEPATKGQLRRLRARVIETRLAIVAQHEAFSLLERKIRGLLLGSIR